MKKIIEKVTDKLVETKEAMAENMENFFNMENFMEKISDSTENVKEKAVNFTSDLIGLSPIIEEIGFKTKSINISVGIPPSAKFHFNKVHDITPEKKQEILELHKDKPLLLPIVKTLVAADDFQKKIALGSFKFDCIEISVGLLPGINVQLIPKD